MTCCFFLVEPIGLFNPLVSFTHWVPLAMKGLMLLQAAVPESALLLLRAPGSSVASGHSGGRAALSNAKSSVKNNIKAAVFGNFTLRQKKACYFYTSSQGAFNIFQLVRCFMDEK